VGSLRLLVLAQSVDARQATVHARSPRRKYHADRSIATQSQSVQLLSAGKDPRTVSAGHLVVGERNVLGSITGTPYESEKTLDFSGLTGVRPQIETMPLEKAIEAYQKSGGREPAHAVPRRRRGRSRHLHRAL
jgi:D-arabinose 1-dehydrogenase-like Zn-dependent alcohol dehydrogenase